MGCAASSLRLWDSNGKFPAKKTATGQRYYTEEDVRKYLNLPTSETKKVVVYCRVSSKGQSKDLERQVLAVEQFCISRGLAVDEWVKEIRGGLNFKRKKFLAVIDALSLGKISTLIVAHRDRLTRFGFDYFVHLAEVNGGEILVMNQESLSPQQEMVNDFMAILETFSCRLHCLQKYKKKLQEDLK